MKRKKNYCPSTDCNNNYCSECYLLEESLGESKLTCAFYRSKDDTPINEVEYHPAMRRTLENAHA